MSLRYSKQVRSLICNLRQNRLAHESAWVIGSRALIAICGLASIRVFTELIPQSVLGAANLLVGATMLGMSIAVAPITQTQARFHTAHNDAGDGENYTRLVGRYAIRSAAAVSGVMTVALAVWPNFRANSGVLLILWLGLLIAASTYKDVIITRANAERRRKESAIWLTSEALLVLLCTTFLIIQSPSVENYVAGNAIGLAAAALLFGRRRARAHPEGTDKNNSLTDRAWTEILSYGAPFAIFAVLGWITNLSERYVLAAQLDAAAVGQYVAAFGIASRIPMLLTSLLGDLLRPVMFEAENRLNRQAADRLFAVWLMTLAVCLAALVLLVMALGDTITKVLLSEAYRTGAAELITWITVGYSFLALAQAIEVRLLSYAASRVLIFTKLLGAVGSITAAILLIPQNGVVGAAQANAVAQGVIFLATSAMLVSVKNSHLATLEKKVSR